MTEAIRVQTTSQPIIIEVIASEPLQASIVSSPGPQGAQGPRGPDPWLDPVQDVTGSGAVLIDYAAGKHVRLKVAGNITSLSVVNWPPAGRIARLTLEILNDGNFNIGAWPVGTVWQDGSVPMITPGAGARDRFILSTTDAGATIFGDPVGFNYR